MNTSQVVVRNPSTLINDIPQNIVDNFIQSEHPQTMAFLLSKMTPDMAADLMGKMPEEMQTDVPCPYLPAGTR